MLVKGSAYAVQEILRLLQWAMKKVQDRELPAWGNMRIWQKFIQKTGGENLDYLNIPAEDERAYEKCTGRPEKNSRSLTISFRI